MSKRNITISAVLLLVSIVVLAASNIKIKKYASLQSDEELTKVEDQDDISVRNNETFGVKLPNSISFAGEEVPLNEMDVRERLDRELVVNSYWHSSSILMLKRANRWLPIIEPILREHNVPEDFKYLAMAESGLQNVVSPAGATGYWQFLKGSGKEQGLIINGEVDERYHVEKATVAACKFLTSLYDKFGSWTLAAAAYNMGPTGLQKQIDRQQQDNYYNLILSDETSRYIFRILAIKSIQMAPHDFGFKLSSSDMYKPYPYKIVIIDEPVASWPAFCEQNNITYRELKLLNPWLREADLMNTAGNTYRIKVMEKNS